MTDMLALLFAAPFVIAGVAVSAWFLCCWGVNADTSDPYEDPDTWGRQ